MAIEAGGPDDVRPCVVVVQRLGRGPVFAIELCQGAGRLHEVSIEAETRVLPVCDEHSLWLDTRPDFEIIHLRRGLTAIDPVS